MATAIVFAYATLKDANVRAKALGTSKPPPIAGKDIIEGYTKQDWKTLEGKGFHTMVADKRGRVSGDLIEVTTAQLAMLDDYEDEYTRKQMVTKGGVKVWVYILKPKYELTKMKG